MSGGSYNYLCVASDIADLLEKRQELKEMAERLEGLPWARDAAIETWQLIHYIDRVQVRTEAYIKSLKEVWHAVEWWDSGDWGEDQVRATLAEFNGDE